MSLAQAKLDHMSHLKYGISDFKVNIEHNRALYGTTMVSYNYCGTFIIFPTL